MKGVDRYRVRGVSCRVGDRRFEVVNLSVGGFFVATDEPLPKGESVRIELSFPRCEDVPVLGQVAWINERAAPQVKALPSGFGVKIVRISFVEKMALLAFLREVNPAALRRP